MSDIHVIDLLDLEDVCPEDAVPGNINSPLSKVFFPQGSMDGACGLYSILMALTICGVVTRAELKERAWDQRTAVGKVWQWIRARKPALVEDGMYLDELSEILQSAYRGRLRWEETTGPRTREATIEDLGRNRPVVLQLAYPGGAHFVVAVGNEMARQPAESDYRAFRIFVLDPAADAPTHAVWNGVIDATPRGGRYPYVWRGRGTRVALLGGLALWRP